MQGQITSSVCGIEPVGLLYPLSVRLLPELIFLVGECRLIISVCLIEVEFKSGLFHLLRYVA